MAMPRITDGEVDAITQVGGLMVVGGTFGHVAPGGGSWPVSPPARPYIVAFDATTGQISTAFAPQLDGPVDALAPAADGQSVYVGGAFHTVNGVASKGLARLSLSNGRSVAGFTVPRMDGIVTSLKVSYGHLYVGGTFTRLGSSVPNRWGLASLSPVTGAVDSFMTVGLTGHHNSDRLPAPRGPTGVAQFDITPDGSKMIVVGNFTAAAGLPRDQIVMLDLAPTPHVDPAWATTALSSPCNYKAWDSWVRGVSFSPDGSYFVVAAGGGVGFACDGAIRFDTASTGTALQPTWLASTGGDSLFSVTLTGSAVYVGGHQRWLNNPFAVNAAGPGAVARPGIAALDPANGLPLAWNPGRNPRGVGAKALYATPAGLWMGSDTEYIGPNGAQRPGRLVFFPVAGGHEVPVPNAGGLPDTVYQASGNSLLSRYYTGSAPGPLAPSPASSIPWSTVHGAFMVNGALFYATGSFDVVGFTGSVFGPPSPVYPYSTVWDSIPSGGQNNTYKGQAPSFYGELGSLTGMAYSDGRLFYTKAGSSTLYVRWFTPDSGVVGAQEFPVASPIDFTYARGLFLSNGYLYFGAFGALARVPFNPATFQFSGGMSVVSGPTVDGTNWSTSALFLYAG
jgi:hypothetical protein